MAKAKRGRRPVHSARKMVVICILTETLGISYWNMQTLLYLLRLPWQEPVPDNSTIQEAFKRIPENYLNQILAGSAGLCIAESGWVKDVVAADSTGIETDWYETAEVKLKKSRRRISIKCHVTAILDYNIIMSAKITSRRTADSPTLRQMLKNLPQMEGSIFNAGKAYDSDRNCELIMRRKRNLILSSERLREPTGVSGIGDGQRKSSTRSSTVIEALWKVSSERKRWRMVLRLGAG